MKTTKNEFIIFQYIMLNSLKDKYSFMEVN